MIDVEGGELYFRSLRRPKARMLFGPTKEQNSFLFLSFLLILERCSTDRKYHFPIIEITAVKRCFLMYSSGYRFLLNYIISPDTKENPPTQNFMASLSLHMSESCLLSIVVECKLLI